MARKPDTGLIKPYRPAPADFRAVFLRLGQTKDIEEYFNTNWRCIRRWIEEEGGDALRAERAALIGTEKRLSPRRRTGVARRYVLGLRLKVIRAPTFFDAGLMEEVK